MQNTYFLPVRKRPVSLVYSDEFETNAKARRRGAQVKRWSRAKKEALVSGDSEKLKLLSKAKRTAKS